MIKEIKTLLRKYFGTSNRKPTETKKSTPEKVEAPRDKLNSLVEEIGKDIFGIRVRVEWGKCPYCNDLTQLLSIHSGYFKCSICHEVIKQYVNGHISYLPLSNKKDLLKDEPKA